MTHGPLDVPHALGGPSVPLPRIDEAPDLGGSAVLPAEDDVVVGVAVERRVEVEEVDRLIGPLAHPVQAIAVVEGVVLHARTPSNPAPARATQGVPAGDPLRGSAYLPMAARREHGPCHKRRRRRDHRPRPRNARERRGVPVGGALIPCPANRRARRRDTTNATPSGSRACTWQEMEHEISRQNYSRPRRHGRQGVHSGDAGHRGNGRRSPGGRPLALPKSSRPIRILSGRTSTSLWPMPPGGWRNAKSPSPRHEAAAPR